MRDKLKLAFFAFYFLLAPAAGYAGDTFFPNTSDRCHCDCDETIAMYQKTINVYRLRLGLPPSEAFGEGKEKKVTKKKKEKST